MKIAISNIAWSTQDDQEMYSYLKENNINNLEIAPTRLINDEPYANLELAQTIAKSLKEEYNLQICSMQSLWFGKTQNMFANTQIYNELLDYTKKCIDFAQAINCSNLVFGSPKNRNMTDYSKDYPQALSFFQEIGQYALTKNIVIAIEPNPTIYNTNFLNTTSEALDFVKKINLPSIKINYDFGTVLANNESLAILKDNLAYVNHIHLSEPNLEIIKPRPIHQELIKILKEGNYQHVISIEMKNSSLEAIKKVISYLKEISGV